MIIPIHWNVGNKSIVEAIMAVRCSEPFIKAMFQRQIMWQMTQMPTDMSTITMLMAAT